MVPLFSPPYMMCIADRIRRADIATLRSQHHICGILTGTLPHLSQQNAFLGIPLVLMPEEVVLLLEKGTHGCTFIPALCQRSNNTQNSQSS